MMLGIQAKVKFAQLEFRNGDADEGRLLFEDIVTQYPKRSDVWSIYLDMELQQQRDELIRYVNMLMMLSC